MLAGHQRVRARSTAARLRSCTRFLSLRTHVLVRVRVLRAGTALPPPPFAFVLEWISHTTPLPPCILPRRPYREICQQPQQPRLLELRPSEAVQASAHVRLAHDPRRIHGGDVHVCSTEAFRCAGSRARTPELEVNFIKRRRYLSHRIYELQGIMLQLTTITSRASKWPCRQIWLTLCSLTPISQAANLVDTLLVDANFASSKFALLLSAYRVYPCDFPSTFGKDRKCMISAPFCRMLN